MLNINNAQKYVISPTLTNIWPKQLLTCSNKESVGCSFGETFHNYFNGCGVYMRLEIVMNQLAAMEWFHVTFR